MVGKTTAAVMIVGAFAATAIALPRFPFPFPGLQNASSSAEKLPGYAANADEVTVSGISSGAFMAIQMQVAYSRSIKGSGSIAGGPWWCAKGSASNAQQACMRTPNAIDNARLLDEAQKAALAGKIDDLSNLADAKLYVYASPGDTVVNKGVSEKLISFFDNHVQRGSIKHITNVDSAHGFPTIDKGTSCNQGMIPWILKCNYDAAGEILNHLYGPLKPRAAQPTGKLFEFDQTDFSNSATRIANTGWAFVPKSCEGQANCRVHVALHGCQQSSEVVQKRFAEEAGYNEWADANDIIVLYPQAKSSPGNPYGCWDWFGYTGANYAVQDGPQMKALKAMIDKVTSAP